MSTDPGYKAGNIKGRIDYSGTLQNCPSSRPQIVHLSTVHALDDARVYHKMARTCQDAGYRVHLMAVDDHGDVPQVPFSPLARWKSRLHRMTWGQWIGIQRALALQADLYHLHDVELLPAALVFKLLGKKVVFDFHEHVYGELADKEYLPAWLRIPLALTLLWLFRALCNWVFDGSVTATPSIKDELKTQKPIVCNNYPLMDCPPRPQLPLACLETSDQSKPEIRLAFVGYIQSIRGLRQILDALVILNQPDQPFSFRFDLGGQFVSPLFEQEMRAHPGWQFTQFHGWLNRAQTWELVIQCDIGLVLFHPTLNNLRSRPNKLFDMMAAGLPLVVSNLESWIEEVGEDRCALFVDPLSPEAVAQAILDLAHDPVKARQFGQTGQRLAKETYCWSHEAAKLLNLYSSLLGPPSA